MNGDKTLRKYSDDVWGRGEILRGSSKAFMRPGGHKIATALGGDDVILKMGSRRAHFKEDNLTWSEERF